MINFITIILSLLPIPAEIAFDKWRWKQDKDDKPLSTYLRIGLFIILAIIIALIMPGTFLITAITAGLYLFSTHLLLFNPLLNLARPGVKLSYRKEGEFWTERTPIFGEYFIKLVFQYATWATLFHWDWVCCYGYPDKLIEYFMF